jgi:Nuclease A inhibitor-like protein
VTKAEIIDRLQQATTDLFWSSEADYPFEIVTWQQGIEMTPTALFGDLIEQKVSIESISMSDFLAPVLTVEDWYEAAELVQVDRYTNLLQAIDTNLSDVQVFRIGTIEIEIYIVGKTPDGDLIGLKTHVVET